ncbi:MAG: 23S rRNA (uracil(1939)-C(5))-methyltransferase RlmD [Oscillospiraceae bacterium]|nr:23S rRNA (uracil(1939)-C(5))-methyltransferase RlmD [Oscillospiraceae bacterium]
MLLKKNEIYETEITGMTAEGNGVCRIDGFAVFVPVTAVGDQLKIKIVKVLKNYAFGIIQELLIPGAGRVNPDCPVFRQCGGCTFRHVDYSTELHYKSGFVQDAFDRIGKLHPVFEPILGSPEISHYRNKAQYPVATQNGKLVCGFYAKHSHRVIPYTDCSLHPEIFREILEYLLPALQNAHVSAYEEQSHTGELRHIYLRKGYHSGEIMLCFVTKVSIRKKLNFLAALRKQFPEIISICESVNPAKTNVIMGKTVEVLAGQNFITDTMCGNQIHISPQSFYQVNTAQAERLYSLAKEYAEFQGNELLLDLYCGAGTIGLSMADSVRKLIGVEIIPQAVENARENAQRSQITNAEFYCGDAGMIAGEFARQQLHPDVVILDPPRKGCDSAAIVAVADMQPDKIIMISCNAATCARDAALFSEYGYQIRKAGAVDLFARTSHCEMVLLMSRIVK